MFLLGILSTLIGVLLGLLGGGGSILTVPVLVYLADLSAKSAIVTSLIVVCITSSIAVITHARAGRVCWKTGWVFGIAGMVGAFSGGRVAAYIPDPVLLVLFATVMLVSSAAMFRNKKVSESVETGGRLCPIDLPIAAILFDGVLVGLVTGLVGVGGGFLLVPALNQLAGLPIRAAIGTSLFIIVMQGLAALAGHASHLDINISLTALVTSCAIAGSFLGANFSTKISSDYLKRGFGIFVFCLGCFLLYKEINQQIIEQFTQLFLQHREFILGAISIIGGLLLYRLWSWLHT